MYDFLAYHHVVGLFAICCLINRMILQVSIIEYRTLSLCLILDRRPTYGSQKRDVSLRMNECTVTVM